MTGCWFPELLRAQAQPDSSSHCLRSHQGDWHQGECTSVPVADGTVSRMGDCVPQNPHSCSPGGLKSRCRQSHEPQFLLMAGHPWLPLAYINPSLGSSCHCLLPLLFLSFLSPDGVTHHTALRFPLSSVSLLLTTYNCIPVFK